MKKLLKSILFVFVCLFGFTVNAETYKEKDIIPVDTSATVETDLFKYDGLIYNSSLDGKGYAHINFSGITSKASSKIPISIDVLLYDENKVNIGYLTYCTDKDVSSDNNRRKIAPNETISFDIAVTKRYFPTDNDKDNGPSKVKYISIMDDNPYCTVGGYSKYLGLNHDEIVGGLVKNNVTEEGMMSELFIFLEQDGMKTVALILIFSIVLLFIQGIILNALHSKMFIDSTLLAYIPIGNNYIAVKCAFGPKIAKIYIILLLLCIPLSFVVVGVFLSGVLSLVSGIAFILVLIKLITKKYDLFYYGLDNGGNNKVQVELSEPSADNSDKTKNEETLEENNIDNNQVVDLNFGADGFSYSDNTPDPSVLDNDSFELPVSDGAATTDTVANDKNDNKDNNQDGGSDLTKFFS